MLKNRLNARSYDSCQSLRIIQTHSPATYTPPEEIAPCQHEKETVAQEQQEAGTASLASHHGLFCCPDDACTQTYRRFSALENHIVEGKHEYDKRQLTLLDKAKLGYASRLEGGPSSIPHLATQTTSSDNEKLPSGWALKKHPKRARFSDKQKKYLLQKYDLGEDSGRKLEAGDVKINMKTCKDDKGVKLFRPAEYLTEQQIASFFSRETAKRRRAVALSESEDSAAEDESNLDHIKDKIHHDIDIQHPIMFDTHNICELVKSKKLTKCTLPVLKDMCDFLNLGISGVLTKELRHKRPYVKKIEAYIQDNCSCLQS